MVRVFAGFFFCDHRKAEEFGLGFRVSFFSAKGFRASLRGPVRV